MEGKQGGNGRALGGSSGESSFLKHRLSPECYSWLHCGKLEWHRDMVGTEPQQATSSGAGPQPLVWRRTTRAPVCSRGVRGSGVASREAVHTDRRWPREGREQHSEQKYPGEQGECD